MAKEIPLSQGRVAIVDDDDYAWISQWKWYANKSRNKWYAIRNNPSGDGPAHIRMHRLILVLGGLQAHGQPQGAGQVQDQDHGI